ATSHLIRGQMIGGLIGAVVGLGIGIFTHVPTRQRTVACSSSADSLSWPVASPPESVRLRVATKTRSRPSTFESLRIVLSHVEGRRAQGRRLRRPLRPVFSWV